MKQLELKILVEGDFSMSRTQLYRKVKHWLEHNAHTTSSFGFELKEVKHMGADDE